MTSKVIVDKISNATQVTLEVADATAATVDSSGLTVTGVVKAADGAVGAPSYSFANDTNLGFYRPGADIINVVTSGVTRAQFHDGGVNVDTLNIGAIAGNNAILQSDAANALALRNGSGVPQTFRVYRSYADAANYERINVTWDGSNGNITTSGAGTQNTPAGLQIGTAGAATLTYLTNNVGRWAINSNGHFLSEADNTYDIGASGANRPRNVHVAGNLDVAGTVNFLPAGIIMPYAGTSEPTGYLFCYGQAVSRTTYAALFTAISTTYGSGDGSTTFNLPDLRGRVVAGQDDMGGTSANRLTNQTGGLDGDTLGAAGGAETHTLTEAQMPAHTHTEVAPNGGGNGYTNTSNGGATTQTTTSGSTGGGGAHNNVQPTLILNYIIKT